MKLNSAATFFALVLMASHAQAQDTGAPLSAIDWLNTLPVAPKAEPVEAPVTQTGLAPTVEVIALDDYAARTTGLVSHSITGLPRDLWQNADGTRIAAQLEALGIPRLPAAQALLYSLMLTESYAPHDDMAFQVARVDALTRMGALDPALSLLVNVGPEQNSALFERHFNLGLLAGDPTNACNRLLRKPELSSDKAAEIFCLARAGDWNTATILFGTADALGLLEDDKAEALARFLDPDLFEGEPPLAAPAEPDALLFTLQDALGRRPATNRWPLVYAQTDINERVGWKAQLEASERLARTGAISDNRLLGIFTDRQPSASGGIWDRVHAIQTFEVALDIGSTSAIEKTLPLAWQAVRQAEIEVRFANLFAEAVADHTLLGAGAAAGFEMILHSQLYKRVGTIFPDLAEANPILMGVVNGDTSSLTANSPLEGAIIEGFDPQNTAKATRFDGQTGPLLLDALIGLETARQGDVTDLGWHLGVLRALGQEDTARRAALQLLLATGAG